MPRAAVDHWKLSSDRWLARVCEEFGITRVAQITGLDRAGVPVACAIRPEGHVLQVTNGKGLTARDAAYSAVMEAAELSAAENSNGVRLLITTRQELTGLGEIVAVHPDHPPEVRVPWGVGEELLTGGPAWVPAGSVFCPPEDGTIVGWAQTPWTSNGLGAGRDLGAARQHALLEVIERDRLARALPEGWTETFVLRARVQEEWLRQETPRAHALMAQLTAAGFEVHVFQVSSPGGVPVAAALLFEPSGGPMPMAAGYACRLDAESALLGALLEAAQTRLTDIHGAREDVDSMNPGDVEKLIALCRKPGLAHEPTWPQAVTLPKVLAELRKEKVGPVVEVSLATGLPDVHVVRIVAPGLLVSELL